jgi:serine protease Do
MKRFILLLFFLIFSFPFTASAQDKTVPQAREQVQLSFAPLVKKTAPAVVSIYSQRVITRSVSPFMGDPFFEQFFGEGMNGGGLSRRQVESALGSGVIVQPDGLIVTNAHVIRDAQDIKIVLQDGREFDARKTLVDEPSDLALLRIDAKGETLPFVSLEPSDKLQVGDLVLAIGNPFGVGQTVTSGIVSALARSSLNINDFNFFIQTDAAINPGNSGGALVAMDGGLVGINTAIFSQSGGSLGIGFAIPSEMVATVIAAEQAGQSSASGVARAWTGMTGQSLTSDIAESLGIKGTDMTHGVLVADLHPASPAKEAGVQVGDVVLSINGKAVRDPAEMKFRMATLPLGSKADYSVLRQGKKMSFTVTAMTPPDDPPREQTVLEGRSPLAGITVANLNPAVAVELGLKVDDQGGVVVVDAGNRGGFIQIVMAGDMILGVNGKKIATVKDLKKALAMPSPRGWAFTLSRNGQVRQIMVR